MLMHNRQHPHDLAPAQPVHLPDYSQASRVLFFLYSLFSLEGGSGCRVGGGVCVCVSPPSSTFLPPPSQFLYLFPIKHFKAGIILFSPTVVLASLSELIISVPREEL